MVMELCPLDLEKVIKSSVTLKDSDIKSYMRMTLKGIAACHANFILHRVCLNCLLVFFKFA